MKSTFILAAALVLALTGDSLAGQRPHGTTRKQPTLQELQQLNLSARKKPSRGFHPYGALISVDCQAASDESRPEASSNRRRRRNRPPPKPRDPNAQECLVKVERFHRRLITNYPTPIWNWERTVEFYQGTWDTGKKCCRAFVFGRGEVCVPEGETITEWGW